MDWVEQDREELAVSVPVREPNSIAATRPSDMSERPRVRDHKQAVAIRFGEASHQYLRSSTHATGGDLDLLTALLDPDLSMTVLDAATGPGHTAVRIAPFVGAVVAVDLAPDMIERTSELARDRGVTNLTARVMDVENLEFADGQFDAVTCRIAPHHFTDIKRALGEIHRVIRPGGRFVVEDSSVPVNPLLDAFLNDVERLRDPTHVRSFSEPEWRGMLEAVGFTISAVSWVRKIHMIQDWLRTAGVSASDSGPVYRAIGVAPPEAITHFEIVFADRIPVSYVDDKILIRADRR
jgi:ubiquinone/menaquinone biosynthesis C-methylase UbiE